jgi:hypothetical protein
MPNQSYIYSRNKENEIKQQYEEDGWFSLRTRGSKSPVDVLALRPSACGHGDHFEVKFIQIKTSRNLKKDKQTIKVEDSTCGKINVEYLYYAVQRRKTPGSMGENKSNKERKDG